MISSFCAALIGVLSAPAFADPPQAGASLVAGTAGVGGTTSFDYKYDGDRFMPSFLFKSEIGAVQSPSGSGSVVGRLGVAAPMTSHEGGSFLSWGDPNFLHSDGQYLQIGGSPSCLVLGLCAGYGWEKSTSNGKSMLFLTPRIMFVYDNAREVNARGGGLQLFVSTPVGPKVDVELLAQAAAMIQNDKGRHEAPPGLFYLVEGGVKYKLTPDFALTGSASVSDLAFSKTLGDGTAASAPALTPKVGAAMIF